MDTARNNTRSHGLTRKAASVPPQVSGASHASEAQWRDSLGSEYSELAYRSAFSEELFMQLRRRAVLGSLLTASMFSPSLRAPAQQAAAPPEPDLDGLPLASDPLPAAPPEPQPPAEPALPAWRRHAIAVAADDPRPKIALVIDDMGVMRARTAQALALPGPLTLAWFPFAPDLAEQMQAAAARGHEALLHMPMQSHSNSLTQTGPDPLRIDLPAEVNLARLRSAIAAVPGVVGLNNHMGSVATRDPALMDLVALQVREHGMLFVDSVVVPHSVALPRAEAAGVPAAARDVFIDNTANPAGIRAQLADIEAFALRHGYAIAIGHPRPHTLAALEEWLPTLPAKGFVLWPIAATVALRNGIDLSLAA